MAADFSVRCLASISYTNLHNSARKRWPLHCTCTIAENNCSAKHTSFSFSDGRTKTCRCCGSSSSSFPSRHTKWGGRRLDTDTGGSSPVNTCSAIQNEAAGKGHRTVNKIHDASSVRIDRHAESAAGESVRGTACDVATAKRHDAGNAGRQGGRISSSTSSGAAATTLPTAAAWPRGETQHSYSCPADRRPNSEQVSGALHALPAQPPRGHDRYNKQSKFALAPSRAHCPRCARPSTGPRRTAPP